MPFLTLDGVTIEVQQSGAEEREPFEIGEWERAFDGSMRVSVRARKREWQFVTGPVDVTEEAAIQAAVGLFDEIPGGGDAIDGGPVQVHARITRAEYIPNGLGHLRILHIEVHEA